MGAQNFIYALKFPKRAKIGDFQHQSVYFWKKFFGQEELFRTSENLGGGVNRQKRSPVSFIIKRVCA